MLADVGVTIADVLRLAAVTGTMLLLSSCSLLLAGDLEQDAAARGGDGGPSPVDAGGRDDAAPADSGDETNDAASKTGHRPRGALVAQIDSGRIAASVEGFFRLEFEAGRSWKPTQLFDLGLPADTKPLLASTLFEPFSATIEGQLVATSTDEDYGYYELVDATPARVTFTTWAHHYLPSGADAKIWSHWCIYASGRVVARTEVSNTGTADLSLPANWQHSSSSVDAARKWNVVEAADARSATFYLEAPSGLGVTTLLQDTPATLRSSSAVERHWIDAARTLAPGGNLTRVNELHFGVTADEALARVGDAQRPGLDVLSNMSAVDLGYDIGKAAYRLRVLPTGPATMRFSLDAQTPRAYPAFEIDDLDAPNGWLVELDGQTVASSSAPVTALGAARYSLADRKLIFVYFDTIAAGAPAAKRSFRLERL